MDPWGYSFFQFSRHEIVSMAFSGSFSIINVGLKLWLACMTAWTAVVPYSRSCHRASSTSCSLSSRGWWKHLLILHMMSSCSCSSPRGLEQIHLELVQAHGCLQELFDFIESRRVHSHLFRSGCCRLLHDIGLCFHGPKIFSSAALHVFGWVWQAPFSFFFGKIPTWRIIPGLVSR